MGAQHTYKIYHLDVGTLVSAPQLDGNKHGRYLVFWWKRLALGHVFIEPGVVLTLKEYQRKAIQAIQPALAFYGLQSGAISTQWPDWVLEKDQAKWVTFLETVFEEVVPQEIPSVVPVSVVICTCNRASQLEQCLKRLLQLECKAFEIIVVDNAPKDNASQKVVEKFPEVLYVQEPRVGLDIARNTGAQLASLPVVAYVDDDVTVHPLWLFHVWETFQDPKVAAMTGLVIAAELTSEAQCIFEKHWSFNRGYVDRLYDTQYFQATLKKGPPVWEIGAGANMAFRREVFEEVGYFHELLDAGAAGCNGDSEMWFRILDKGHTIHYNPRAIAFHEHRSEVQELKRQIFYYMRGHTVAALLQQKQQQRAGYAKYLTKLFFLSFPKAAKRGFPYYRFQYKTLWSEVLGVVAGVAFYMKHIDKKDKVTVD